MSEAPGFIGKAERFLDLASRAGQNPDGVTLAAVHAGISAADAVCAALIRRTNVGEHFAAAELLARAGEPKEEFERQANRLRRLIALKRSVEYESKATSAGDARRALATAERLVSWAREQVERAAR